jgi:hypothetical protein
MQLNKAVISLISIISDTIKKDLPDYYPIIVYKKNEDLIFYDENLLNPDLIKTLSILRNDDYFKYPNDFSLGTY